MNAPGQRLDAPALLSQLASAPGEFDFAQAVDVLEQIERGKPGLTRLGQGSDPAREALALSATFELSFRAQPIERVGLDDQAKPWMLANFFGLAGPDGPLPDAYIELIRTHLLAHDSGAADFLSIFQHRLLALAYRAEDAFRAAGPFSEPGAGPLTPAWLAVLGQVDGDPLREQIVLSNIPICAQQRHSLHGFLLLIERQFGVVAQGEPWAGRWVALGPELQTVLGRQHDLLGQGAVLGQRAWNQDGAVRIDLGVISAALYRALLPGGARHRELCVLCAWYLGPSVACLLRMALAPEAVSPAELADGCLLGHTSWLAPARVDECAIELVLNDGNDGNDGGGPL